MNASANAANVSAHSTFSNDPFADDFFQSSFVSPTVSSQNQQMREDASGTFFASFDITGTDSTSQTQVSGVSTDPFSPIITSVPLTSQTALSSNVTVSPIHSNSTSIANDLFAQTSVPFQTSSPIVTSAESRDPFSQLGTTNVTSPSATTSVNMFESDSVRNSNGSSEPAAWMLDNAQTTPTVTRVDSFDTDFSQTGGFSEPSRVQAIKQTNSGSKRGSLLPAPPTAKPRSGTTGSRPRPRSRDSIDQPSSILMPTSPASNMDPFKVQSSSFGFSPESNTFSSDFNSTNFTSDNESTLHLSNPLYLSPPSNNGSLQGTQALNTSNGIPRLNELPTADVSGSTAQTSSPPVFPIDANWGSDNFQPQVSPPMQQQTGALTYDQTVQAMQQPLQQPQVYAFGDPASQATQFPVQQNPGNMAYQFPPQDPSFSQVVTPQVVVPIDPIPPIPPIPPQFVSNPTQEGGAPFSPPSADTFPLSTNNPFAGDFESPPFAVHSSTPQTPNRKENGGHVYPNSSSPLKPSTTNLFDGPDPFANLLPLALSPAKEKKSPNKVKAVEKTTTSSKNSNTTQAVQDKRPTLSELVSKRNSFQSLDEGEQLAIGSVGNKLNDDSTTSFSEDNLIAFEVPKSSVSSTANERQGSGDVNTFQQAFLLGEVTSSSKTHSFDDNFDSGSSSSSPWVAF